MGILNKIDQGVVAEALDMVSSAKPLLDPLRDGAIINGYPCRLSIGTLALLNISDNPIFSDEENQRKATLFDVMGAFYMCIDDNLNEAVRIADDIEVYYQTIRKFESTFSNRAKLSIIDQFYSWLHLIYKSIPQGSGQEAGTMKRLEWWVDAIDILASQYHWPEFFIMWELPLVRALKYCEKISARMQGVRVIDDIDENMMKALDLIEAAVEDGKQGKT